MPPLAQTLPQPSFEFIGLFAVTAFFFLNFYYKMRADRRAEDAHRKQVAEGYEPKANPPLHKEYFTRREGEAVIKDVAALQGKVEHNDHEQRRSVGRCYEFTRTELGKLGADLQRDIGDVEDKVDALKDSAASSREAIDTLKQNDKEHGAKLDLLLQRLPKQNHGS